MRPLTDLGKLRRWRRSMNVLSRDQHLSVPNSLGGSRNVSLLSLDTLHMLPRSTSLTSVLRWADCESVVSDNLDTQTVHELDFTSDGVCRDA